MKVATFNVKNKSADMILKGKKNIYKKIMLNDDLIFEADPDIIGLQEVTYDQLLDLMSIFGSRYELFGEFRHSIGMTDEACPIMVRRDLGVIQDINTYSLSSDIESVKKRFPGAFFPRVATDIYLYDETNTYHITNVHVDNSPLAQKKTFDENGPLEKILYKSEEFDNIIHIQLGDFNSEIDGDLNLYLCRNFLSDATSPLGKTYRPLNKSIDHILYSDNAVVNDVSKYENKGSDHALLMADINPKNKTL